MRREKEKLSTLEECCTDEKSGECECYGRDEIYYEQTGAVTSMRLGHRHGQTSED